MYSDCNSTSFASAGFETACSILSLWECSSNQVQCILQLSKTSYHQFKEAPDTVKLNNEQLERISYILNIHYALRCLFSNQKNVRSFMKMKNNNDFFRGRSPLEIIEDGGILEFSEVSKRINALQNNL